MNRHAGPDGGRRGFSTPATGRQTVLFYYWNSNKQNGPSVLSRATGPGRRKLPAGFVAVRRRSRPKGFSRRRSGLCSYIVLQKISTNLSCLRLNSGTGLGPIPSPANPKDTGQFAKSTHRPDIPRRLDLDCLHPADPGRAGQRRARQTRSGGSRSIRRVLTARVLLI